MVKSHSAIRIFGFSIFLTVAALLFVWFQMSIAALLITLILIIVEITFSFENAVINAKVFVKNV